MEKPEKEKKQIVILEEREVIDMLKILEGLKRKLQPLLKKSK